MNLSTAMHIVSNTFVCQGSVIFARPRKALLCNAILVPCMPMTLCLPIYSFHQKQSIKVSQKGPKQSSFHFSNFDDLLMIFLVRIRAITFWQEMTPLTDINYLIVPFQPVFCLWSLSAEYYIVACQAHTALRFLPMLVLISSHVYGCHLFF